MASGFHFGGFEGLVEEAWWFRLINESINNMCILTYRKLNQ